MTMTKFNPKFLVVSLGNPLPEYSSLHSAGHFALRGLAQVTKQAGIRKGKLGKLSCLVSQGPKYTLVQSEQYMNVSGPFVAKAWQEMLKQHDPASLSLIILHDELEKKLGQAYTVPWDRSPRGHNGIKSVKKLLSQEKYPQSPLVRIAVGIDRPEARDPETVSRYVLDPISREKQRVLETEVPWEVKRRLEEVEEDWRSQLEE